MNSSAQSIARVVALPDSSQEYNARTRRDRNRSIDRALRVYPSVEHVVGDEYRRVVVVTGASAGIGRAAARAFAQPGVCVALLARGERGLQAAAEEVEQAGAEAFVVPTDVADHRQVAHAADEIVRRWGRIDVWVNNAMVTVFGPVERLAPEDLKRATEVTYLGAAYGTMAALKQMRAQRSGVIVQVGSALAYRAIPLQAAYCAAKHALRGFTDAVRSELLHEGSPIHITNVHLSAFNTPQFDWAKNLMDRRPEPVPPIFQPELAAEAIVWAASHRRREVYVGWPSVKAVLANKIVPGILDRVLAKQGYSGQLTSERKHEAACENLYEPCDANPGAHGRFDRVARTHSLQWFLTSHRGALLGAAAGVLIAGAVLGMRRSAGRPMNVANRSR